MSEERKRERRGVAVLMMLGGECGSRDGCREKETYSIEKGVKKNERGKNKVKRKRVGKERERENMG